jgi:hypothetical protein
MMQIPKSNPLLKAELKFILQILVFTVFFLPATVISQAQLPDSSSMPMVWLRADKGEFTGMLWKDFSGFQRNATALKGEGPVKNSLFNFNPAVSFNGNNYMKIPYSVDGLPEVTVMAVFQSSDSVETGIWGAEDALSRNVMLTTRRAAGPDSAIDDIGRNESFAVISTVVQNWEKTPAVNDAAFLALGSAGRNRNYQFFKGILAEILVFDKRIDFATQLKYETYLGIKYGIPVTRGNYLSSNEKVLWRLAENKEYGFRITGLGKDTLLALDQKQSRSALDRKLFLTMGVTTIAKTNDDNPAMINNGDYLVWGDNNGSLATAPGELDLVNRKYLMHVSGFTASGMKTKLQVDLKQLPRTALGYWLVIDRSGQGHFSADDLTYIKPTQLSVDSIATFDGILWDTDGSGKDMFGFVKAMELFATVNVDSPSCRDLTEGRADVRIISGKAPFAFELRNKTTGSASTSRHSFSSGTMNFDHLPMGDYELRLSDADGAEMVRRFAVTVPNALSINLGPDRQLGPGEEIILDATTGINTPVSYRWLGSYGMETYDGTVKVRESGIYKVEISTAEGCLFSDEIVISGTSKQRYEVYPSVSSDGNFNVSISLPAKGFVSVAVYDIRGAKQLEWKGHDQAEYFFKNQLKTPGVYMVVLKTTKGSETRKLIVQ